FNTLLLRFIHNFTVQTAHSALANGHHTIEERLARWLLMCHDRVGANEFEMTHQFLAIMLAVRRSGVTEALNILEGKSIIQSTRGRIEILSRSRLERAAGGSYGVPEEDYERLISPMRQPKQSKKKP
ncbi:MAG: winged helix-turn-helix domain-containing protein, partial [Rhizobiales bacterium]|nr:winged helix-turn-helix domain-containing protein [Hyphomicrobiales bacterium]